MALNDIRPAFSIKDHITTIATLARRDLEDQPAVAVDSSIKYASSTCVGHSRLHRRQRRHQRLLLPQSEDSLIAPSPALFAKLQIEMQYHGRHEETHLMPRKVLFGETSASMYDISLDLGIDSPCPSNSSGPR